MRRRELAALLGGAAIGWPLAATAQQPRGMRRVVIMIGTGDAPRGVVAAIQQGLQKLGWRQGENIQFIVHYSNGEAAEFQSSAAAVVNLAHCSIRVHGSRGLDVLRFR